jgi:integrase
VLNDDEIRARWFDFGEGNVSRRMWLGLRLLLVTVQRRGEVTRAGRQEFDVDHQRWLIPAAHRGKKKTDGAPRLVHVWQNPESIRDDDIFNAKLVQEARLWRLEA